VKMPALPIPTKTRKTTRKSQPGITALGPGVKTMMPVASDIVTDDNVNLEPDWLASSLVWSILSTWPVALIMFIISSFLYLWYRVKHMVALYKLIEKASVFRFTVKDDQQNERKIVCVANVVSPADELPIFSPQPAEQPRTSARTSSGGARPDEPAAHKAIKESSARADELATHDYYSDQGSGAA
jgi:hypothetical protein